MDQIKLIGLSVLVLVLLHHHLRLQWYFLQNNYHRRLRRWCVRPVNRTKRRHGFQHNLYKELVNTDHEEFFDAVRMWIGQFSRLVSLITPYLSKRSLRQPISVSTRLAVTLSYLAQGDSVRSKHLEFRLGKSTVHALIPETCRAIWRALQPLYLPQMEQKHWESVSEGFMKKWQFPSCIGAIHGRHMRIKKPPNSVSQYYNYKGLFSMVLLATCSADYKFTWVDIGQYGSISDGGVWANSDFASDFESGDVALPPPKPLPHRTMPFPHVMLGDEGFPLKTFLMRPFARKGRILSHRETVFNYRLSRARRVIENAFGILTSRWQVLDRPLSCSAANCEYIFRALACLHNFLMDGREFNTSRYCPINYPDMADQEDGQWRQVGTENYFRRIGRVDTNNTSRVAEGMRQYLADYFSSDVGEVQAPWQYERAALREEL